MVERRKAGRNRSNRTERILSARTKKILFVALTVFITANVMMALLYRGRVLPHFYLGKQSIGGMKVDALAGISSNQILPAAIALRTSNMSAMETPAGLGITVDAKASLKNVHSCIRWVPLASLVSAHHVALNLQVNVKQFDTSAKLLGQKFYYPATDKYISFNGNDFVIAPAHGGYSLASDKLLDSVRSALQQGKTEIAVPTVPIPVHKTGADLTVPLQELQQKLSLQIKYVYKNQVTQTSKADIGSMYETHGQVMVPSPAHITNYVHSVAEKYGVTAANPADMTTATMYALSNNQSRSFTITPQNSGTFIRTYCTAADGVSSSVLSALTGKLAVTYNDIRGWNDGGTIAFRHVSSGCQYTVWLASSNLMTSFGSICDAFYNCQVGTNVVLNYDRWTSATPPWNATHGSLEDYRTLMIDHETGHRLGFRDNNNCPGTGQRAPVMMQQSVNLKGCVFNVWPLQSEFAQLNSMIGAGNASSVTNIR